MPFGLADLPKSAAPKNHSIKICAAYRHFVLRIVLGMMKERAYHSQMANHAVARPQAIDYLPHLSVIATGLTYNADIIDVGPSQILNQPSMARVKKGDDGGFPGMTIPFQHGSQLEEGFSVPDRHLSKKNHDNPGVSVNRPVQTLDRTSNPFFFG